VLMNPVRAGFPATPKDWTFLGCVIPGYPNLHPADPSFWPRFWQLYANFKSTQP
jgi:hypothetical protein